MPLGLGFGGWPGAFTCKKLYTWARTSVFRPPARTADAAVSKPTTSDALAVARASAKAVGQLGRAGAGSPRREKGSAGFSLPGTCSTSKRNSSISSSQRARNRLTSRFVRSHVIAAS